jgi:hypothetical protein
MIDIEQINNKRKQYPEQIQEMLLAPEKDSKILSIFQRNKISDTEATDSISSGITLVATDIMSKEGLYQLVKFRLNDDETLAKKVFYEIDTEILTPNNFVGLKDESGDEDLDEDQDFTIESTELDENKEETAEDILREIENPTPSPLILPRATTPTPQTPVPTITPVIETALATPPTTPIPTEATPPQQEPAPNKETQLDSKLTDTAVQTAKSTYYKVDPYREQAE